MVLFSEALADLAERSLDAEDSDFRLAVGAFSTHMSFRRKESVVKSYLQIALLSY